MKHTISISLMVVALASCATEADKQDVSDPLFDVSGDDKADSARKPSEAGTLRIAEVARGTFGPTRGFVGYEIQLDAGRVDIDLTGSEDGEPLDTILYVFGPKRPNGHYRNNPIAFNDDFEPGVNLGSHIVLDVPAAGTNRDVVSTYDNYVAFPYHLSTGDYQLIVKCQSETWGACGPAVSELGGACWADTDCLASDGTPLHCEGEITCAPGTQCLWVQLGTCVATTCETTPVESCEANPECELNLEGCDPAPIDPETGLPMPCDPIQVCGPLRGDLGESCGSRGMAPCDDGLYCQYGDADVCGAADGGGACALIPDACIELFAPVCGCDGVTYSNGCFANMAGQSVGHDGACL